MHRVVVTGIGVICALGKNKEEYWESLKAGRVGIGKIRTTDCSSLRFRNGAEVPDYEPSAFFPGKEVDLMDRFAQFAVIAAREAVHDAALDWNTDIRANTAVEIGRA